MSEQLPKSLSPTLSSKMSRRNNNSAFTRLLVPGDRRMLVSVSLRLRLPRGPATFDMFEAFTVVNACHQTSSMAMQYLMSRSIHSVIDVISTELTEKAQNHTPLTGSPSKYYVINASICILLPKVGKTNRQVQLRRRSAYRQRHNLITVNLPDTAVGIICYLAGK
jgi:hypothetical protein